MLILHSDQLPDSDVVDARNLREGDRSKISTKLVYGELISLRVAVRHSGYHSRPHIHNSEQLNYLADGELWIYVEDAPYRLQKGDFMRVPRMAVHWAWNNSDKPCTLYESHCPPNVGNPRVRETAGSLFDEGEHVELRGLPMTIWLSDRYAFEAEKHMAAGGDGGKLMVRDKDLPDSIHHQMAEAGQLSSKFVYGLESNLMVATRGSGYHSKPHIHDCEQLNYLVSGELWIFLSDAAYFLRPGDFMRLPRMVPHWAWNTGKTPCVLVEAHCPVLDPSAKPFSKALLTEQEALLPLRCVRNYFSPENLAENEESLMKRGRYSKS